MMKRTLLLSLAVAGMALMTARQAAAHCEVPCGIYTDQLRFEQMLEDTKTIAKAITSIHDLSAEMQDGADAQKINQVTRWVTTKESHATNTQHIIAQYFMTQRIKADAEGYVKKLTAAHAVMVAAMKCKQAADPATAETLKEAILDFYRAYEGKEPQLESE
jgi:nickel superoxide dismutase